MDACTDRLEALLARFPVRAQLFHSGALCGVTDFSSPGEGGQIHLIQSGVIDVIHAQLPPLHIGEPSLLMYPTPMPRRFVTDPDQGARLACARLGFEGGEGNPLVNALPRVVCVPLSQIDGAAPVLSLLFDEAFGDNCGRRALVDRLFEALMIQLLRHLMESGCVDGGMLAGMSHPSLRRALIAMHEQPAESWSLDALGAVAGMSRSAFANAFRNTVGCTPGAYLQGWRVQLAQQGLKAGRALKLIAIEVGYGSEAALSRVFKAQCGVSPRQWRQGVKP
ncbi:AraC family transcriptional regulator [Nitrogeniibacter aestuarii]|uniref:AraC family transcriptional regulator n=1 Tax=Nitrogeniibacter aestuarii TaxID=2815343 RepID=UPI001E443B99|nr:AraC family transcriptional regulator [Nitrogeniibacter aestuarii]